MSLRYIIDGYNLINHPLFARSHKRIKYPQLALLEFIRSKNLTGSYKNKVTVVFDGYLDLPQHKESDFEIKVLFSGQETADEKIKKMLEGSSNCRTTVVVSDDREIKFFAKLSGARAMNIEEFAGPRAGSVDKARETVKPGLNYSQVNKINQELSKIWLK